MTEAAPTKGQRASGARLVSLDGLRGLAAVVVLLHHAALAVPGLAATYYPGRPPSTFASWLAFSPLHLAWAGTEAVYLFFVLSGFVLYRLTESVRFRWDAYYPSRLVRLYLPVFGAVAFAAITFLLVHRTGESASAWISARPVDYSFGRALVDITLIGGTSGAITPLWSLTWEVLFSLLLPAYVFAVRAIPVWVLFVGSLALLEVGAVLSVATLSFLPIFAIGVCVAASWRRLEALARSINARSWRWCIWLLVFVASAALTLSYWWVAPFSTSYYTWLRGPIVLGVTGLVLVAMFSPAARRVLSTRVFKWLGRISFSLYLTHEPIVIAFAYLFPGKAVLGSAIAIIASVLFAWLFAWAIEGPSHRLSRRIGERIRSNSADRAIPLAIE